MYGHRKAGLYLAVVNSTVFKESGGLEHEFTNECQIVCDALRIDIWQRRLKAGLIHHADKGSQCTS